MKNPVVAKLPAAAVEHLQAAVRLRTESYRSGNVADTSQFLGFHRLLQRTYPLLHRTLRRQVVGGYSLCYEWAGQEPSAAPVIVLAHYDVVPVDTATLPRWKYPPFGAVQAHDTIWGRGTTDNKANAVALLEAVESALLRGQQPRRTVFLVLGHDEEVGGMHGARQVAQLLQRRGIRPAFVLDEGGYITRRKVPGMVGRPVALIGTAEKGYLSLQLSASLAGGHAAMPEKESAVGLVAGAVASLQQQEFAAQLTPAMQDFATHVGPHLPFGQRVAFANQWLLRPLILRAYRATAAGAAAVRTTIAPTVLQAGMKDNVIPASASAIVNLRLLPTTTAAGTLAQVRAWLPDQRVQVRPVGPVSEPTAAASTETLGYRLIDQQLHQLVPGVVTTPFLFVAQSDARHFQPLTTDIYRFSPTTDPQGMHGENECVSVASFTQTYCYFAGILRAL
ncbi:M20/M25/M40 family metallo-hydrolase [Hymenobacter sp. J193]|uniref:M20/M25/M40 family metallo-hydrolase n=1 Tax=Hymenobacter sp. J193 TaxID=2898429 RepID=UPI0021515C26|nr:M20/M25/M40 family metallo-hydrolase [Hymenobacter sp. J193]MCR5890281.1 M20/M25/M40 family metallo-hydrolase [Hymenobacter sp. J193]MCR5890440.1 M20/M25/M40 family metallo-hydrolase [Hymenobacter sp. J193]